MLSAATILVRLSRRRRRNHVAHAHWFRRGSALCRSGGYHVHVRRVTAGPRLSFHATDRPDVSRQLLNFGVAQISARAASRHCNWTSRDCVRHACSNQRIERSPFVARVGKRAGNSITGRRKSLCFSPVAGETTAAPVKESVSLDKHVDRHAHWKRSENSRLQVFVRFNCQLRRRLCLCLRGCFIHCGLRPLRIRRNHVEAQKGCDQHKRDMEWSRPSHCVAFTLSAGAERAGPFGKV